MSRSGYSDDCENVNLYRGQVERAMRGKRGQAFFRELLAALDAMPEKRLIAESLKFEEGAVCALGAVAVRRGYDKAKIEQLDAQFEHENQAYVAQEFGIAETMTREIVWMNDEAGHGTYVEENGKSRYVPETPEKRFERIRNWAQSMIREPEVVKPA